MICILIVLVNVEKRARLQERAKQQTRNAPLLHLIVTSLDNWMVPILAALVESISHVSPLRKRSLFVSKRKGKTIMVPRDARRLLC
jgi:hypothetical protein